MSNLLVSDLHLYTVEQLKQICRDNKLSGYSGKKKADLIEYMNKNNIYITEIEITNKKQIVSINNSKVDLVEISPPTNETKVKLEINFSTYIYRVLRQLHNDISISSDSKNYFNDICIKILKFLMKKNGLEKLLDDELYKYAVKEGINAITKYKQSMDKNLDKLTVSSGLQFNVGSIMKYILSYGSLDMKKYIPEDMQNDDYISYIFVTAILEYLVTELLEFSGNVTRHYKRKKIIPQYTQIAIHEDEELEKMFDKLNGTYYKFNLPSKLNNINFEFL